MTRDTIEPWDSPLTAFERKKASSDLAINSTLAEHFGTSALSAEAWLAAIVESSDDAIVSKTVNGIITSWNKSAERLFGFTAAEAVGRHISIIIPDDRLHEEDTIIEHIRGGRRIEHFETIRQRKDGTLLDISLTISPVRDKDGVIVGASKIARDISERKRMAERQRLLLREMHHRIKNLFATVCALISVSERSSETQGSSFADDLRARVRALAAAQNFVLKESESGSGEHGSTSLFGLIEAILSAHQDNDSARIVLRGHDVHVDSSALTSLALLLHEFATNAIKYGSLSVSEGRVEIEVAEADKLVLTWAEVGGPPAHVPIGPGGFGSELERMTISSLRGSIRRDWHSDGLRILLEIPYRHSSD
ncbi:PAS domain S-box protein [Rhizobium sp. BR 317]|uniref:PAS domain S-box protein n=1 Tax=Rhizobium sp. BR 317 TaxID=3040015 RepID=UPI0039BEF25B